MKRTPASLVGEVSQFGVWASGAGHLMKAELFRFVREDAYWTLPSLGGMNSSCLARERKGLRLPFLGGMQRLGLYRGRSRCFKSGLRERDKWH